MTEGECFRAKDANRDGDLLSCHAIVIFAHLRVQTILPIAVYPSTILVLFFVFRLIPRPSMVKSASHSLSRVGIL